MSDAPPGAAATSTPPREDRHVGVAAVYGGIGRRSKNGLLWGVVLLGAMSAAMATFLALRANAAQAGTSAAHPTSTTAAAGEVAQQQHLQVGQQQPKRRVVVVGGGLAGSVAALHAWDRVRASVQPAEAAQHLYEVVLVDKMPKLGGNSAKASSGINALHPAGGDSQELFEQDTLRSGGDLSKPDLVATLVAKSQAAIQLLEGYGVDLSKVTQLGGHSKPRSHTNPVGGNVGWSIMSKIMAAIKASAPGIRTLEGHKLEELLVDPASGAVRGVRLVRAAADGSSAGGGTDPAAVDLEAEAVVLATGGFAANRELLARHNPASAALATTNGPWAQGEGLDVAARAGARLRDLEQVQVHPTGFVDPADEQAGTKFLAPEKLRGVGAVMLNRSGERFVDELGTRDVVSDALSSQEGKEAWLLLPASGAEEYGMSAIQFYVAKKLMAKVGGVEGLAQHTGAPQEGLAATLQAYNQAKDGGGPDALGKTVFPAAFDLAGDLYVARVTPVVHYTMGGVEIDDRARVMAADGGGAAGQHIHGLFAAGEVSGGVHGRNRLGGNSLLECVVYGTIAGDGAAARLLEVPLSSGGAAQQSSAL